MLPSRPSGLRCVLLLAAAACMYAQTKPGSDVLIFVNGDKLVGELKSADAAKVVFKSDMAGLLTVEWSKIQELRSAGRFAAVPKALPLRNSADAENVPRGTLTMTDQKLAISAAPQAAPQTMAVSRVANVIDEKSFEKAIEHQGVLQGWKGGARFGLVLSESTQNSTTLSSGVNLARSDPSENWLRLRSRTIFDFNQIYGKVTTPGAPDVTIAVLQSNLVQDYFFRPRLFAFGGAAWEHNSNQGLKFMQSYGGGLGVVVIKTERKELEARASVGFIDQQFSNSTLNHRLIGSRFGESYSQTFWRGIVLTEQAGVRPAWNYAKAFFADGNASLTVPVYKRLGVSFAAFDSFLNNPPPGFKKNSFQLTVGANYAFK